MILQYNFQFKVIAQLTSRLDPSPTDLVVESPFVAVHLVGLAAGWAQVLVSEGGHHPRITGFQGAPQTLPPALPQPYVHLASLLPVHGAHAYVHVSGAPLHVHLARAEQQALKGNLASKRKLNALRWKNVHSYSCLALPYLHCHIHHLHHYNLYDH